MGLNLNAVGDHVGAVRAVVGSQGRAPLRPRRGGRGARPHRVRARVHDGELRRRDASASSRRSPPSSGRAAVRGLSLGEFDPAMLVHGEQSIRLHGELPAEGTVSTTTTVAGMYDKGAAGLVVLESASRHADSGEPAFSTRTALFIRGAGGFGGPRNPEGDDESALAAEPLPTREPDEVVSYSTRRRPGAAVPVERGPQPAALRPDLRQAGGLRRPDPARPVHLRVHGTRPAPRGLRLGPGALRRHACPLLQADHARRHVDRLTVGHRRPGARGVPVPHRDAARARRSSTPDCSRPRAERAATGSARGSRRTRRRSRPCA